MDQLDTRTGTALRRALSITRQYRGGSWLESALQLCGTFAAWLACYGVGLHLSVRGNVWAVPFGLASAAFTLRLFMIQHDCGHHSFFRSRRANEWTGFLLGVITMTPHQAWYRCHALHHAGSGNLERRGIGDIRTLTVDEYRSQGPGQRLVYRLYRSPLVLFGIGPIVLFGLRQRFAYYLPAGWARERLSTYATNGCLLLWLGALFAFAPGSVASGLAYHVGSMALAASLGVWLFYVQHQFPDAYWEHREAWSAGDAALRGSSFYDLPGALRWLTASIGLHHIHHLDSKIPNYRLQRCFREHACLQVAPRLTLGSSLGCMSLKLWDPKQRSMVGFQAAFEPEEAPVSASSAEVSRGAL